MSAEVVNGILVFAVLVTVICLGGLAASAIWLRRSEPKSEWLDPADR